jgi:NAD(P)-dependent dehydrogenase (short-subunit alcohol dehydrogenase family)
VAIITGASRGIGQAIAQAYANEGASLCLIARNKHALDELAATLNLSAAQVMTMALDVTDREACFQAVAQVKQHFGRVDTLVNNAGIYRSKTFLEYTAQDFQELLDVNLFGVLHFTQACLPHMQQRQKGSIINIASTAGKWGSRNQSAYNASKHAVVGLTRCLALEMSAHNVLVNAICPWVVDTDMATGFISEHAKNLGIDAEQATKNFLSMVPIKRFIRPEEVANLAVFLASDESSYVNGQSWAVDGGYSMI